MEVVLAVEIQRGIKKDTLSFLPRKRECIKMLDYYLKSGAKVDVFDEKYKELGDSLLQFNNLKKWLEVSLKRCL